LYLTAFTQRPLQPSCWDAVPAGRAAPHFCPSSAGNARPAAALAHSSL